MKRTVNLYDQNGNEAGTEEIEIIEVGEHKEKKGEGIGYIATITEVRVICSDKVNKETIDAELDEIYGYFNYEIK